MLAMINWNERPADFPVASVEMQCADSPEIRERLRSTFGADHVEWVGRGFNNGHHRLRGIPGSQDLMVRRVLAPIPALAERSEREYRVLEALQAVAYPYAPRPVRRLAPGEIDACPGFVMTAAAGEPMTFADQDVRALGVAVGLLHSLPVPDWLASDPVAKDPHAIAHRQWTRLRDNFAFVEKTMPQSLRVGARRLLDALPARLDALSWPDSRPALLHGDLGDHNTLIRNTSALLLDWEFTSAADPLFDLAWLFSRDGFGTGQQKQFLATYGGDLGRGWRDRLAVLSDLVHLELALWAQSGLDDLEAGRNGGFFQLGDAEYLMRYLDRLKQVTLQRGERS